LHPGVANSMPCGRVSAGASSCGITRPQHPRVAAAACGSREPAAFPAVFSEHAMPPGERRRFSRGITRPQHPRLAAAACGSREPAAFPAVFSAYAMPPGERRRCSSGITRSQHPRVAAAACGSLRCLRAAGGCIT
jgi:hypothetical protein